MLTVSPVRTDVFYGIYHMVLHNLSGCERLNKSVVPVKAKFNLRYISIASVVGSKKAGEGQIIKLLHKVFWASTRYVISRVEGDI